MPQWNTVFFLRLLWTVVIIWFEIGIFYHDVRRCQWPDTPLVNANIGSPTSSASMQSKSATHVLLIADPQILDHRSYNHRAFIWTYLTQVIVDLNLRKNWHFALRKNPDLVIFLGDMMDEGRFNMEEEEYERYHKRFRRIFKLPSRIPAYFVPGNHDIGLRNSSSFSPKADARFRSHFGLLNSRHTITNHSLIFLDAPSLVEEDDERIGRGKPYELWTSVVEGPVEFVRRIAEGGYTLIITLRSFLKPSDDGKDPVVLFSHIPFAREKTSCGPLRESGTIHSGRGMGYENTLGKELSVFLLSALRPSVIFSADDHDYCEQLHPIVTKDETSWVKEVSVKSFSMAMGIRRPGFQLLSLFPRREAQFGGIQRTHADMPCFLPDQIWIYLSVYVRLLVASFIVTILSNARRRYRRGEYNNAPEKADLPRPISTTRLKASLSWSIFVRQCFRCSHVRQLVALKWWGAAAGRGRERSCLRACIGDMIDVGMIPLTAFVLISVYFFM